MKVRSWLATTCSSTTTTATATQNTTFSSAKHLYSDTSSASDSSPATSSMSSLQSNLSLQTLPSVPSLQKLTPETLNVSISYHSTTSLKLIPNLQITCLALHDNLLYAASTHIVNVYDRTTCHHLHSFSANNSSSGSIKSITFCNGKIFTAHQDCKIRVWKLIQNYQHKLLTVLPTVKDRLSKSMLPKNYVNVRRHKKMLWIQHADAVTSLAVNNGFIYSVSWDKCLKIWRASDLRCLESVKAHEDAINAVVVSVNGTVYTGSADCKIRVWAKPLDGKKHTLVATLEKHKSAVNALALNDDGSVLFSGACDRSILVWEREDSANHMVVSGALRGHGKAILSLINVSDLLLSGSADRTVRIWQRGHDGKYCCLAVLEGHNKPVKSLAAVWEENDGNGNNHDNRNSVVSVFSGSLDGEIKAWQVSVFRPSSLVSPYQILKI
ncbi:F-box and wd40 domain protein, putative [Ricinus communis]|uniref:F-box and wd40 domain protein, putative n=1 Tax=Ricinus communis TaxID=3988 RepID=B9RMT1_RICCO|nr:F-box and wd40 domain protein, putative [Ricinus communis]|eukprot:XP_002515050.1 protein JINGUBANG [Ricinus communis]